MNKQKQGGIYMNNEQMANRIKSICKQKKISISELLSDCELTKSFIYDLERRKTSPSCDKIYKIANRLECSVDYLLGITDNPNILINMNGNRQNNVNGNNTISIVPSATSDLDELTSELIKSFKKLTPIQKAKIMVMVDEIIQNG